MKNWIIRFFGLKGSWKWACRKLDEGHIVYRTTDTGSCKYKLDPENQRRILWDFYMHLSENEKWEWENAYIFLSDFESVDYAIYK